MCIVSKGYAAQTLMDVANESGSVNLVCFRNYVVLILWKAFELSHRPSIGRLMTFMSLKGESFASFHITLSQKSVSIPRGVTPSSFCRHSFHGRMWCHDAFVLVSRKSEDFRTCGSRQSQFDDGWWKRCQKRVRHTIPVFFDRSISSTQLGTKIRIESS